MGTSGQVGTSAQGPRFDVAIAPGGYAWWYLDALSPDGQCGLTVIALLGNVFSPYYARARARSTAAGRRSGGSAREGVDPLEHCALNVALYGADGHRWAMTERRRRDLRRDSHRLQIGPSALCWDGDALTVTIDEVTAPWPSRLRGTLRVRPNALFGVRHSLDAAGRHRWQPIAPRCSVEVDLQAPAWRWQGTGYLDSNDGDAPLEQDFDAWTWSRTAGSTQTVVFYDVEPAHGAPSHLALSFDDAGGTRHVQAPPVARLPRTRWRLDRPTRSDANHAPRLVRRLEDGPFYARSVVAMQLDGDPAIAVHESLSLRRFRRAWVRMLLPFKMPRPPPFATPPRRGTAPAPGGTDAAR